MKWALAIEMNYIISRRHGEMAQQWIWIICIFLSLPFHLGQKKAVRKEVYAVRKEDRRSSRRSASSAREATSARTQRPEQKLNYFHHRLLATSDSIQGICFLTVSLFQAVENVQNPFLFLFFFFFIRGLSWGSETNMKSVHDGLLILADLVSWV